MKRIQRLLGLRINRSISRLDSNVQCKSTPVDPNKDDKSKGNKKDKKNKKNKKNKKSKNKMDKKVKRGRKTDHDVMGK